VQGDVHLRKNIRTKLRIQDSDTVYIPGVLSVREKNVSCHLSVPSLFPSVDYMLLNPDMLWSYETIVRGSKKGKANPVTVVEAHRVVRRRGSHIF
jgi:hypothetical protein